MEMRLAADLLAEFHGLCVLDGILSGDKYSKSILPAYSPFLPSRYRGRRSSGQGPPPFFATDTSSANCGALFATGDKVEEESLRRQYPQYPRFLWFEPRHPAR
jgi:hypothetical protein